MNEEKTVKDSKHKKYVICCQILSIFASHAQTNIRSKKEEY
ncbi:MAG: hypothetical protein NY202_02970 [Mollicutes bacterium UO1]